ncbi:MAG TPA: PDZ domain-containing protein [Vicinamibacterales bacterium]|jgi:tricorn protease
MRHLFAALCVSFWAAASAATPSAPLLLQQPTINRTHIVFVFAGDLWTVPREGGAAIRLTSGPGIETGPVFSPDGTEVAFTGEYDGNVDVFVVPAAGGVPKRLTWHPAADLALGWTPDGKRILFSSTRTAYSRFAELFTVPVTGGPEEKLPLPQGFEGSYSADGLSLAYVPKARAFRAWKRYRGGQATSIRIVSLATSRVETLPHEKANEFNPMWVGDTIYFLSDRNGPVTLFSYHVPTKRLTQVVENRGLDFKAASAGPDAIAYEQFGAIGLYDLKTGKARTVAITVAGDLPEVRERLVKAGNRLENAGISPSGARAVFEARGEIVTVPAEKGDVRNITNTTGVMERDPAWSPDGKRIAYFSDESGEYALHIRNQDASGEVVKIALAERPTFYSSPTWSPDSRKIAYNDAHLGLWYVDVETKKPVRTDTAERNSNLTPAWSPDSKWLTYTKRLRSGLSAIYLCSLADGKVTQLTDGMSDARSPVFDKDGKFLYFTASTDSGASMEFDLHASTRPVSRSIYLVVLSKDEPSPFSPESDEEKAADDKADPAKPAADAAKPPAAGSEPQKADAAKPAPKAVPVKIDFDNILQRVLAVPMPARRYSDLQVAKAGVLLAIESPAPGPDAPRGATVHRFDLKARKSDVVTSGVSDFVMSANGEKMLYRQGERWFITALKPLAQGGGASPAPSVPSAGGAGSGALQTDSIEVRVDPRTAWRQMYHEVWRIEREFFYDPHYHGLDLVATEKKYAPYLDQLACRADLNYLFNEMLGELTVGHLYVGGGEMPEVKRVSTGLLGADYTIENGRYRFARVYNGENWSPQLRAPLTQPGVNVKAGEYLLAVNGRDVRATENVHSYFEGMAGRSVLLKVGASPNGDGAREVTVVPVPGETALRNLAWIEGNRRHVDSVSHGRIAYVYMPDTAGGGLTAFNRYFFAQVGKEGVIVDERFNGGGALATDIIEYLQRKLVTGVAPRDGADSFQPQGGIFGPKAMIINEEAGSGGDAMPWLFKRAGLGPLIGKRTWGGLVGIGGYPPLMDGGSVTAPSIGVWNATTSQWEVENVGIAPDIEVEMDPELVRQGKDPQLDKAIEVVMAELAKHPVVTPKRPAYPDYQKK